MSCRLARDFPFDTRLSSKHGSCILQQQEREHGHPLFTGRPCANLNTAQGIQRLVFGFVQPIWRPAVVKVEAVFIFSGNRRGLDALRAGLDGFPGETDIDFGLRPAHPLNPRR